jgi:hypothetical protein
MARYSVFYKFFFIHTIFLWIAGPLVLRGIVVEKGFKIVNDEIIVLQGTELKIDVKKTSDTVKTTVTAP